MQNAPVVWADREVVGTVIGAGRTPHQSQKPTIRKTAERCLMQSLGGVMAGERRHCGRNYRRNAIFVMDVAKHCTKMDRNAKAKLLHACEVMERATKRKGRRNGLIGVCGLIVLRTLLLRYHGPSGLCCPSYSALQRSTGLCRQSIAQALRRLRAVGVLRVTARLVRMQGMCRQASNLYEFSSGPRFVPLVYSDCNAVNVVRNFPQLCGVNAVRFKSVGPPRDNGDVALDVPQLGDAPVKCW
jgi:hypothetical protein